MNYFSGFKNPFASKSSSELEAEKTAELAKLSQSYDEKIAAAKEKEGATSPDEGTTTAVGGRRRKTRRGRKNRKSRKARK